MSANVRCNTIAPKDDFPRSRLARDRADRLTNRLSSVVCCFDQHCQGVETAFATALLMSCRSFPSTPCPLGCVQLERSFGRLVWRRHRLKTSIDVQDAIEQAFIDGADYEQQPDFKLGGSTTPSPHY